MQSFNKKECKITPVSIINTNNLSSNEIKKIEFPFCRKRLDFTIGTENESNSTIDQKFSNNQNLISDEDILSQTIKRSKKSTAIVAGTVQSNNKLNIKEDAIEKLPCDLVNINCINYNGKTKIIKVPSNTKRNARERKRVRTINDYFNQLQKYLPNENTIKQDQLSTPFFNKSSINITDLPPMPLITTTKKLSKVETLKAAIEYIEYLQLFAPAYHYTQKFNKSDLTNKKMDNMIKSMNNKNMDRSNSVNIFRPKSNNSSPSFNSASPSSLLSSPSNYSSNSTNSSLISSSNNCGKNLNAFKSELLYSNLVETNSDSVSFKNNTNDVQINHFDMYQNQIAQFESTNSYTETTFASSLPSSQNYNVKMETTFSTNNSILNPIDFNVTCNNYNIHSQNNSISSSNINSNSTNNITGSIPQLQLKDSYYYNNSYTQNYVNSNKIVADSSYNYDASSLNQDFNYSRIDSLTYGNNSTGVVIDNNFL